MERNQTRLDRNRRKVCEKSIIISSISTYPSIAFLPGFQRQHDYFVPAAVHVRADTRLSALRDAAPRLRFRDRREIPRATHPLRARTGVSSARPSRDRSARRHTATRPARRRSETNISRRRLGGACCCAPAKRNTTWYCFLATSVCRPKNSRNVSAVLICRSHREKNWTSFFMRNRELSALSDCYSTRITKYNC